MALKRLFSHHQPLDVYRVMKYDSQTDAEIDLTTTYLQGEPLRYEQNEYLEFRIRWKSETYRYIVDSRNSNFPSYREFAVRPRLMIVKAVLMNTDELVYEDVTDRVRKFLGPASPPFFGRSLTCAQLFRNDDLTDKHTLMIIDSNGEMHMSVKDEIIDLNNN